MTSVCYMRRVTVDPCIARRQTDRQKGDNPRRKIKMYYFNIYYDDEHGIITYESFGYKSLGECKASMRAIRQYLTDNGKKILKTEIINSDNGE